jgi:hypothetical protein
LLLDCDNALFVRGICPERHPDGMRFAALPIAYFTVYLGLLNPLRNVILSGDCSYGIYLYGFPVQQAIVQLLPTHREWYWNLVIALPVVIATAVLSWWMVEKPCLARRSIIKVAEDRLYSRWRLPLRVDAAATEQKELRTFQRNLSDGGTTMWLGNGGGSFFRTTMLLQVTYEIGDPTWAKLTFEYGFIGLVLVTAIFATRLYSGALQAQVCNYLLFVWIINSTVLKVQYVLVI